jgi:hypothetical protein
LIKITRDEAIDQKLFYHQFPTEDSRTGKAKTVKAAVVSELKGKPGGYLCWFHEEGLSCMTYEEVKNHAYRNGIHVDARAMPTETTVAE